MEKTFMRSVIWTCGCLMLLLGACESEYMEEATGYPQAVEALLVNTCATEGCHSGPNAQENLNLDSWQTLYEGSDFGAVLIPYSTEWSHLFQHLNTYEDLGIMATPVMPPVGEPFSREEVETIKNWINSGAPDRDGNFFWAAQEQRGSGKVFALCAGSDLIAVADLASNRVMRMVPVGDLEGFIEAPHYIQISPDGAFMYVTLISGGVLEKYRTDNYERVARLELGPDPALIQMNPSGSRAVISHWNNTPGTPKLSLVDLEQMSIVQQVSGDGELLSFGHGLAATSDFSTLYVVANEGNYYSKYSMNETGFFSEEKVLLDPAASPVPQASTQFKPYHCFLQEEKGLFFVSCNTTHEVRVYQTANDSLIARIPTGTYPRLMDYDPVDELLYVACRDEVNPPKYGSILGCVSVIDVNELSWVKNIYGLGHRPHGVSVAAQGRKLFVSSENVGGVDPPHHPLDGTSGPPGKYHIVDLNTLEVLPDSETEIAVFPNALVVRE